MRHITVRTAIMQRVRRSARQYRSWPGATLCSARMKTMFTRLYAQDELWYEGTETEADVWGHRVRHWSFRTSTATRNPREGLH